VQISWLQAASWIVVLLPPYNALLFSSIICFVVHRVYPFSLRITEVVFPFYLQIYTVVITDPVYYTARCD
jgi:hypothetical protein